VLLESRACLVSPSRGEAPPDDDLLSQSLSLDVATTSDSGVRAGDEKVSPNLRELQFKFEERFSCNLNTIAGLKWFVLATYQKQVVLNQKLDLVLDVLDGGRVEAPATETDAVQGRVQLPLETQEVGDNMADSQFKYELVSLIL